MNDNTQSSSSSEDQPRDLTGTLRRVQKLLAIANDSRANPAEAAAAASQAEKIMRKYQIEHADLVSDELKTDDNMGWAAIFANMQPDHPTRPGHAKNPPWGQFLAVAIADLHGCKVRQAHDTNPHGKASASLRIYGYKPDVEVAVFTFNYLLRTTIRACETFNKSFANGDKRASNSFRGGFINELTRRLRDLKDAKAAEMEKGSDSRALVVSKDQAVARAFGEFNYKKTQTIVSDGDAYHTGVREARKIDLQRTALGSSGAAQRDQLN